MKSRTLNTLLSSIFILCLMLTIVFSVILFVTENNLYLILICVSLVLAIGIPNILVKYIKVDILKELEENDNRNIQQELIYHFLKGNYGPFLPLDEYDTEMEVYTNFANIGYINKEFQEDPHMAVYIELFKKHFKITYINNGVIRKYEEFNSIDEIFSSIENTCKSLVEK